MSLQTNHTVTCTLSRAAVREGLELGAGRGLCAKTRDARRLVERAARPRALAVARAVRVRPPLPLSRGGLGGEIFPRLLGGRKRSVFFREGRARRAEQRGERERDALFLVVRIWQVSHPTAPPPCGWQEQKAEPDEAAAAFGAPFSWRFQVCAPRCWPSARPPDLWCARASRAQTLCEHVRSDRLEVTCPPLAPVVT